MIGQTISHYRILEKLGEGGMGVVYKAQDTNLDRLVALKFLPQHLHAREEETARFVQEAKTAATLNHPNICVIHDIKEEDGKDFIVMEFVDGETLREKFSHAPINTKEAVTYAVQIGEALEEAHAKGIVHRDIKSDNIMVNKKNQVKVMDFGLAKLKGSLKLTRATSTVGTLGYMAPEQIRGGQADARSDIFSFGVVLFEMLTGKLPFRGEHEAALMYSIMNEEPEALEKFVPDASPELLHILRTALEKDPNDRYQTAAEITNELRRLLKQSSRVSRAPRSSAYIPQTGAILPEVQPQARSKKMLLVGLAVGVIVVAAAIVLFLLPTKTKDEVAAVVGLNPNMTLRMLAIPYTQVFYPSLSADGNWIAFPAGDANNRWDVYYMHISGNEARRVSSDSSVLRGDRTADISPDGSQIVYDRFNSKTGSRSEICVVSSLGGMSKPIVQQNGTLSRWRPDGQRIGYVRFLFPSPKAGYNFWSIKPDGSDNRLEFPDTLGFASRLSRFSFAWSPDGRSIAWVRSFKEGYQEVVLKELETGKERQLTFDKKNIDDVCWTRKGMIVFSSNKSGNTNLWMVPTAGGASQQITKGSGPDIGISISADNQKLLYYQQQRIGHVWTAGTDGSNARQVTFDDRQILGASLSPDGKQIAFTMNDIELLKPGSHLYLMDRNGGNRRQVTSGDLEVLNPIWSPDGKWIAFSARPISEPADSFKNFIIDGANPGTPKQVGYGQGAGWVNSSTVITRRPNAIYNESASLEGEPGKKIYEDSTFAFPVASGKLICFFDNHKGREGFWVISADYERNPTKYKPKKLPLPDDIVGTSPQEEYFYYWNQQGELWRMNYSNQKKERVAGSIPALQSGSPLALRQDEKELIYVVTKLSGKFVLIENLFQ